MNLILLLIVSGLLLLGGEVLKRRFSPAITRRISHIGAALIAAVSPLFLGRDVIIIACLGFAGLMYWSHRRALFSSIHLVQRRTYGEVFLPLGEALSAALFLPNSMAAFQFGVLVMGLSDALAGFVGEKYGKHEIRIFRNKKTVEGSLVFFAVTLLLTFFFIPEIGMHLIFIPVVLTLIELVLVLGLDNLVLPIVAALLFQYFRP